MSIGGWPQREAELAEDEAMERDHERDEISDLRADLAAAQERIELLEGALRLMADGDWPGLIETAKALGITESHRVTFHAEDYDLEGSYADDARYIYPAREMLMDAIARALLSAPTAAARGEG